jgi:hypothetical protein
MAKDPSKKGVRKIPQQFLDWIAATYSPEMATWYKTNTGRSKALASQQRIKMSEASGSVGAFHEGHFQGAKDFDLETQMGGGPTTGRTMRPEIGVVNVAHAEMPRISKADMKRLGIPQYWVEDFYEAILESEGLKVLGNPDIQAALAMDRGMSAEQAAAQARLRDDLRSQGAPIPGSRPVYSNKPAPLTQLPTEQVIPPEFDVSDIKKTGEVKVKPRTSRVPKVPQIPSVDINIKGGGVRTLTRILPGQLDDIILGGTVSAAVGGATLLGGGTPAQAAEAAGATFVDIATDPGGMQGSGAGERFYPDGMERQSPEGLARAQREREEAFQKSVVQPFNQIMNFVGGVVRMIPSGVGF